MTKDELLAYIQSGRKTLDDLDFSGLDLSAMDLSGLSFRFCNFGATLCRKTLFHDCDLYKANFEDAQLNAADFSDADLSYAKFTNANARYANFTRADMYHADLSTANCCFAILARSKLWHTKMPLSTSHRWATCFEFAIGKFARQFARECPPLRTGGRIVYRTGFSQTYSSHYVPGNTYTANDFSWSVETECHPGIYAGSARWIFENLTGPYIRCYVRDGDWTITAKGCIRCRRLRVLAYVTTSELEQLAYPNG